LRDGDKKKKKTDCLMRNRDRVDGGEVEVEVEEKTKDWRAGSSETNGERMVPRRRILVDLQPLAASAS
jgi:hypothetical protein